MAAALMLSGVAYPQPLFELDLQLGSLADYGASPWYTEDLQIIGSEKMKLAMDNGADFIWATSDLCTSPACKAHAQVDTSVPGFQWIDKTGTARSFGPWGEMSTWTALSAIGTPAGAIQPLAFFAAIDYQGNQFRYLAWDGGIGLPARKDKTTPPSAFFPTSLKDAGLLAEPVFSQVTNREGKVGKFFFGGVNESYISGRVVTTLTPDIQTGTEDAWSTNLHGFTVGDVSIAPLAGTTFFLDTGSSRFKGDHEYVYPVLTALMEYTDPSGNPIFEAIQDQGEPVGLVYSSGAPQDYGNLPDITMRLGTDCGNAQGVGAIVTLSPEQHSYKVEVGDRAGQWVIAFRVLDQIGGLLVGSTLLDLVYSSYEYNIDGQGHFTQGNMKLYSKSPTYGSGPAGFECATSPMAD